MTFNVQDEKRYQMNPLAQEALSSVIRHLLGWASGYLVARGIWTGDQAQLYVSAAAMALITFGWSFLSAYWKRQKLVTSMSMPEPSTERQVEAAVRAGKAPPVTTPKNEVPVAAV